ncbi:PilN domain-containing protein [Parasedimentitalea huanghaiensis]|uniref:Uncharacterized protein n=1 Tax=Parasedimentitalea huanghaiensis TaxID=2682100 RepID=A0A6L6WLV7_9RHOB|nr:PilN domain-containing protein [Zongyanglinia huanghaiensis]MVO18471.1 hypothetical protein [Zongyanglinia huanghaiensis]
MAIKTGDLIDLELGEPLFLTKRIPLPVAAKKNLNKIIDMQIKQSTPGRGENVVWRSIFANKSKQEIEVRVALVKRPVLVKLEADVAARGAQLRTVRLANFPRVKPLLDNRQTTDRGRRFWSYIIASASVVFCMLILVQTSANLKAQNNQVQLLQDKKTSLEREAVQLRKRLDQSNANFAEISQDIHLFEAGFLRLPLILDLTQTLDDSTWISNLSLNTEALNISGFSGREITTIISDLRALSWVSGVELQGPISFDSFSRRNRFDLSIELEGMEDIAK